MAKAHAKTLASTLNNKLVTSPSYVMNGLFLCRQWDSHFEDHNLEITGDGTIDVLPVTLLRDKYSPLNGTKVSWAHLIGSAMDWPNAETLDYRNTLAQVCGEHRQLEFGVDSDDSVLGSASEDEEVRHIPKKPRRASN